MKTTLTMTVPHFSAINSRRQRPTLNHADIFFVISIQQIKLQIANVTDYKQTFLTLIKLTTGTLEDELIHEFCLK